MSKKILISVSYGASADVLAADIGCIEQAMQAACPDWELRRAFTSWRVRAMWARQGHPVPDPAEAIAQAKADGAAQIALAALLISPGGEFEGIESAAQDLPVATPLLTDDADLDTLAAYYADMREGLGTPLLIMGHGHPANGNPAYLRLRERLPKGVYLGCLSGEPSLAQVLPELLKQPARKITVTPLLMSVGGHTLNDMADDTPDSWKSQLTKAGFDVHCHLTGIGRLPVVQQIFVQKQKALLG